MPKFPNAPHEKNGFSNQNDLALVKTPIPNIVTPKSRPESCLGLPRATLTDFPGNFARILINYLQRDDRNDLVSEIGLLVLVFAEYLEQGLLFRQAEATDVGSLQFFAVHLWNFDGILMNLVIFWLICWNLEKKQAQTIEKESAFWWKK